MRLLRLLSLVSVVVPTLSALDGVWPISGVTASNASGGAANLAIDGSAATAWKAAPDVDGGTGPGFTVDLGAVRTWNVLEVVPTTLGRAYRDEISSDGTAWTTHLASFQAGSSRGADIESLGLPENGGLAVARAFAPVSARWLRLTCLTVRAGEVAGLAELRVANDPAYATLGTRLASLSTTVAALPATTTAQALHRAVLGWAVEDAGLDRDAARFADATAIADGVDARLASPVAIAATAPPTSFRLSRAAAAISSPPVGSPAPRPSAPAPPPTRVRRRSATCAVSPMMPSAS